MGLIDCLIEHGLTSAPTQYRLYSRRFLQVKRPSQQCQSTEGESYKGKQFCWLWGISKWAYHYL